MQQIACSRYCRFQKKLGVSGFSGYPKLFQLALQLAYLAGESTVIEYLNQRPGQFPAAPCGAGVQDLHPAYLLIVGLMRVAEHGKLRARLLRGIDERIHAPVAVVLQVPVRDERLDRAELNDVLFRSERHQVAVAADAVDRQPRKLVPQLDRVPVMVAEMYRGVGAAAADGFEHKLVV